MSSGLTLQGRRGAPGGNTNAGKDGLWSARPPVRIEVAAAVPLPQLAGLAETISGGALWIAEALADVEHPQVDEGEVEQKIALYAAVAGEAAHLQAVLEGRTGVRPAPLGELTPQRYERLTRQSAGALSLMLSQVASAKARLEVNGLLVAGPRDNERLLNRSLNYLAGTMRKTLRQVERHAGYVAWRQGAEGAAMADPAAVLAGWDDDED